MKKDHDPVNHPRHYTSSPAKCSKCETPIECIDVTRHMNFNLGNSVKYVWRADLKDVAIEDLKKAVWYINDEIKKRETETRIKALADAVKNIKEDGNFKPITQQVPWKSESGK